MKVIWLRKQYGTYLEYVSTSQIRDSVWKLQAYAAALKQYLPHARDALDTLEQTAKDISQAINEGNDERIKNLVGKASQLRRVVSEAMSRVDNDWAREIYQVLSDAIRALEKKYIFSQEKAVSERV
jgi:hypothetical protein